MSVVSDSTLTIRAFSFGRPAAGGHTPRADGRFRISLRRATNRSGQAHERAAHEHHCRFIPHPWSLPWNCRNGHRCGHRRTNRIGFAAADCWRCGHEPQDRQRQIPPTHKVEPHSLLVDGTPRPSRLDKLQSVCHGGALSNCGQNTSFHRRGSIQAAKWAERYPNVPKGDSSMIG